MKFLAAKISCVLLLICFISLFNLWASSPSIGKFEGLLLSGIKLGLQLNEEEALTEIKRAIALDQQNPLGYAFLTMAHLFFYETSFSEKEKREKEKTLIAAIAAAQTKAEERIDHSPQDAQGYLALAISKMVKNRYELFQKNYFRAFREARGVWSAIERVRELAPQNYEVYYLSGLLHYYLAHLPGASRWFSSLFIVEADAQKGLKELEVAATKSLFMKDLARANLISIYAQYEKKPEKALPLAETLVQDYPQNYNLQFVLANIYSDLEEFKKAFALAEEIDNKINAHTPPYRVELRPRYHLLLGKIYFDQGQFDRARIYLNLALQDQAFYNARVRAWALVRLGMIHDAQKERELAQEFYQKALEVEGAEGTAQRAAREYLSYPYSFPKKK